MKTSKLKLRPFIPYKFVATGDKKMDEQNRKHFKKEGMLKREPFATLSYGNVTIELDYTLFRWLSLDVKGFEREKAIFNLGLDEILHEMDFDIMGREEPEPNTWFRDNPKKCSITHPYSPFQFKCDNWKSIMDGSRNMEWKKRRKHDAKVQD